MQTIFTKVIPATNTRGAKIKAYTSNKKHFSAISLPSDVDINEAHLIAATKLKQQLKWSEEMTCGDTEDGVVCVFSKEPRINPIVDPFTGKKIRRKSIKQKMGGTVSSGKWHEHQRIKDYIVWKHKDNFYQITKGKPPTTESGYPVLNSLLKLKGLKQNPSSIKLSDIVYETPNFYVLKIKKGFAIYKTSSTHSTKCAHIGFDGEKGLTMAIKEIARREEKNSPSNVVKKNPLSRGVKIVYNGLLGGWYVVRGPHHAPLSGRFDSKVEAKAWLESRSTKRNPAPKFVSKKFDTFLPYHVILHKRDGKTYYLTDSDAFDSNIKLASIFSVKNLAIIKAKQLSNEFNIKLYVK